MADYKKISEFFDIVREARCIINNLECAAEVLKDEYVERCKELSELYKESGANHLLVYNLQKGKLSIEDFCKAFKMPNDEKEHFLEELYK